MKRKLKTSIGRKSRGERVLTVGENQEQLTICFSFFPSGNFQKNRIFFSSECYIFFLFCFLC